MNKSIDSEKHQFAFYWQELSEKLFKKDEIVTLKNPELFHRLFNVLRLNPEEKCIFFDEHKSIEVTIKGFDKKNMIIFLVDAIKENVRLTPAITFLLPLLKREAFEQAIYSLVELGVNKIQLVITEKSQRKWGGAQELDRLKRIMIAAAEQSKNFSLPGLYEPKEISIALTDNNKDLRKIFFDSKGLPAYTFFKDLKQEDCQKLMILVGPEGDLTNSEKNLLHQNNILFCRLTPTILRAQQAVVVGMGLLRTLL